MKPLVHTRDQETVKKVEFTPRTCSEEGETVLSAGNVMTTVSWRKQGVIYIDYLKKGNTITGLYYAEKLGQFDAGLQKKRPHLATKKVLFHNGNTRLTLLLRHGRTSRIRL
ncbi:hypothetical protein PYW07_009621 [Mythimna separata]|uniref:Uncharacterized protein n=1 Tax=Mythimna separata TaxID=271217 RepID=A0AAD8DNH6_MYTSE|nr:hypothetical protein PYW07_009621 [Mythimna separata]